MDGVTILTNVMYVAVVIVSLLLICLVLVQPSKSGGMGAAFGGIGQSAFGAQASSHLTKLTVILTSVFFVLALLLAMLVARRSPTQDLDAALMTADDAIVQDAAISSAAEGTALGDANENSEPDAAAVTDTQAAPAE